MSTTVTASPTYFTGVSTYASDLQQVITRCRRHCFDAAAAHAEPTAESGRPAVRIKRPGYQHLRRCRTPSPGSPARSGQALTRATSSSSAISASVSSGALEGSYSVDVTDLGSYSTSVSDPSLPAVADPNSSSISTSSTYTLTVNGTTTTITPAGSSLMDLAQAINSASAGVQASVVNTGSSYQFGRPQHQSGGRFHPVERRLAGSPRYADHRCAGHLRHERPGQRHPTHRE